MRINHKKIYYVGGMISLIILPILFFVATIGARNKAIHYGSIEVQSASYAIVDYFGSMSPPESLYVFIGSDETTKLSNFQTFIQNNRSISRTLYRVNLSESCSYNFFVQVLDILHRNKFTFGLGCKTIRFAFRPDLNYEQESELASTTEEIQYIYSELSTLVSKLSIVSTIKEYFADEPKHQVRILKYTDLGPPSPMYGPLYFSTNSKIKEEPKSSVYFRVIGLWFVPIILLWLFLFIMSIRRNRKLLPNPRIPAIKQRGRQVDSDFVGASANEPAQR